MHGRSHKQHRDLQDDQYAEWPQPTSIIFET